MKGLFNYIRLCLKSFRFRCKNNILAIRAIPKAIWRLAKQEVPQSKKDRLAMNIRFQKVAKRDIHYPSCLIPRKLRGKKITVLPCLDSGFFSIFNNYVSHLAYAEQNEIILPDWRVSNIFKAQFIRLGWSNFKLLSFCYGTRDDGNIFYRLFENPYPKIIDEKIYETDKMYHYADKILDFLDYNEDKEPNLTALNSYNLYSDEKYFPVFRKKYNDVLKKYIHLKPEIQKKIDDFYEKNLKGYFVVSAFIRCKGHALELKEGSPDITLWEKYLLDILKKNKIATDSDKWRFYIASDNDNAINYFSKKYPENVVFQNMKRLTNEQEEEYERVKEKLGQDTMGYELQHRAAADESQHSLQHAIDVIFDVYTAASADYLIFTNSNMSTAASYINPKVKMVYCK